MDSESQDFKLTIELTCHSEIRFLPSVVGALPVRLGRGSCSTEVGGSKLKKYKVVGFKQPNIVVQLPKTRYSNFEKNKEVATIQEPDPIEIVTPEIPIFNQVTEVSEVIKRPRGRQPKKK